MRTRRLRSGVALFLLGTGLSLVVAQLLLGATGRPAAPITPPVGQSIAGDRPLRFAVMGDSQGNMSVFEDILARVKADDVKFILHMGDLVKHCSRREFDWLLRELAEEKLDMPFCAVPGNHDSDKSGRDEDERLQLYMSAFGPRRYWFSCADVLFVAFDDSTNHCLPDDLRDPGLQQG